MPSDADSPTIARPEDAAAIGALLARPFHGEEVYQFVFPDEQRRAAALPWMFASWARYAMRNGRVWVSPGAGGAALWRQPGQFPMTWGKELRSGMLPTPWVMGLGGFRRLMGIAKELEIRATATMTGPFWYCWLVGVAPEKQGQGLGWRLIGEGLKQADAAQVPCYLETATASNVDRYTRYGFKVIDEFTVARGAVRMWNLRRDPA